MTDPYAAVADRLATAGFRQAEPGCFVSTHSPRVIGLAVCAPDHEVWRQKADALLRTETMRLTLAWARFVVLLVIGPKSSALAWPAAAFGQDVSKCRRIVLFGDPKEGDVFAIPFLGLPEVSPGPSAPAGDVEGLVRRTLSATLADAFLNEDLAMARVVELAEQEGA